MIEEFAAFFKVNISEEMDEGEISKFMDTVTEHLNEHYHGEAEFVLIDIKGKPN